MAKIETFAGHIMPKQKEITDEDINKFFEGSDPMKRIITIELGYDDADAEIVYVDDNGVKRIKREPFKPFVWAKNSACIRMCGGKRGTLRKKMREYGISVKPLYTCTEDNPYPHEKLDQGYKYLFYATSKMSMGKFQTFFKEVGTPIKGNKKIDNNEADSQEFMTLQPVELFMIQTGKRYFKGYESYDELKRMIFDLETEGLNPKIHHISQIGIWTNKGYRKLLSIGGKTKTEKDENEIKAIEQFVQIIAEEKPDVLLGHNSENFDWYFIIVRCQMHGIDFKALSGKYLREGIYKRVKPTTLKLGGEVETFYPTIIKYHNVVDSLHAVRRAMATDSSFEKANLKYATQYLKLNKENRVYVPGNLIETTWRVTDPVYAFNDANGDWYKITDDKPIQEGYEAVTGKYIVERYLLDDLWECDKVELSLHETDFHLTKIMPTTFSRVATMGTATQWKLILLTWAYEHNTAVPSLGKNMKYVGGLSKLVKIGAITNATIIKGDYAALYPTTEITWNIEPCTDFQHVTLKMLMYILTMREYHKSLKKKAENAAEELYNKLKNIYQKTPEFAELTKSRDALLAEKANHDNQQLLVKKLANSWFGSLGCPSVNPWGDLLAAEKTTCIGRCLLRLMISYLKNIGYEPIVGDSFTGDTPLFIKYDNTGLIDIKPIEEMIGETETDALGRKYDYSKKPYSVLCRSGWVKPQYIYRHRTNKQIYRVEESDTIVDVTEDHSLFNDKQEKIKPSDITSTTKLEYYNNQVQTGFDYAWLTKKYAQSIGKMVVGKTIDRVPTCILNTDNVEIVEAFLEEVKNVSLEGLSKTCQAGIQFLRKKLHFK
jgi:DNA polymerase I